ncbi:MAG: N-acetylmuramoyl-L-alanine amidase [Clostridia bacterium]|nr:N-acetylmuramoyl-L-alanine amidase [Clostridia bacterium]
MRTKTEKSVTLYVVIFTCMLLTMLHLVTASIERISQTADSLRIGAPVIVIDAGHGGEDGGAEANGVLEKDINLQIAQILEVLLRTNGFDVLMLREEDIDLGDDTLETVRERKVSDLKRRAELVKEAGNCILISIHQNYFEEPQYSGAQAFFSPQNPKSELLGDFIQTAVKGHLQANNKREIKPGANIWLLEHVSVPAVLVECGFLSNSEEAVLLSTKEYQQQIALCIFGGVCDYLHTENEETWRRIFG